MRRLSAHPPHRGLWRLRALIAVLLLTSVMTWLVALAQNGTTPPTPPIEPDAPSPATRHAQVIAHGLAPMPAPEVGWQVTVSRAVPPDRTAPETRPAGFVLAEQGTIALVDADGTLRQRIAPGEAAWIAPEAMQAVVSLDDDDVDYYEIALVPATALDADGRSVAGEPFDAPSGGDFDVDLIRDVLDRDEESAVPAGAVPALILVTSGSVFVAPAAGEVIELATGEVMQAAGDIVVTGASRTPAAFVVARIGVATPARIELKVQRSRSAATPAAKPVATLSGPATVTLTAFVCPISYGGSDFTAECIIPAEGTAFSLEAEDTALLSYLADAAGRVLFADVAPGEYVLLAGLRGDFAPSRVSCRDTFEREIGGRRVSHQLMLTLTPGDAVHCDWYIVPEDERVGSQGADLSQAELAGSIAVAIRVCPPGMTIETLIAELCEPAPPGVSLSLNREETPRGVATATADLWTWAGLPPGIYTLVVNAMPSGFDEISLNEDRCCDQRGGFSLTVRTDAPTTDAVLYLAQPAPPTGAEVDFDDDGLTDARETEMGTHPFLIDSDEDSLSDGDEVDVYGTDPLRPDTDDDGLDDAAELLTHGTNPFLADTEGDGVPDAVEVASGTDPLDPASLPTTPTALPTATPLPTTIPTPQATPEGTPSREPASLPTLEEARRDDFDRDGLTTADEIGIYTTNPTIDDSDRDGRSDGDEVAAGTDPLDPGDE